MSDSLPSTIVVVGAIVDTKQATFYLQGDRTLVLQQGDSRLKPILDKVLEGLTYPGAKVTVHLSRPDTDVYQAYEKRSGWGVKFFKVAKSLLNKVLAVDDAAANNDELVPQVLGSTPATTSVVPAKPLATTDSMFVVGTKEVSAEDQARSKLLGQLQGRPDPLSAPLPEPQKPTAPTPRSSAVAEIMAHAQTHSTDSPTFGNVPVGDAEEHTVVAVVDNQIISGAENLKSQFIHSVRTGSTKGMDNFLRRCATVIAKRRFSIDDLLKFLKQGDLPITDDGSIIIYKVLRSAQGGRYVDCHTGNVSQRVGSLVCMDESLVDPDRRQACSNGLHVATRRYVNGFGGDVICLGKVRPEDVIAVPEHDVTKMRVSAYHLLIELNNTSHQAIRQGRGFTASDEEAQILLGRALSDDFPAYDEIVKIGGHRGTNVVITQLPKVIMTPDPIPPISVFTPPGEATGPDHSPFADQPMNEGAVTGRVTSPTSNVEEVEKTKPQRKAQVLPDPTDEKEKLLAPPVDPRAMANKAVEAKVQTKTKGDHARELHATFTKAKSDKAKREAAQALLDYKKAAKKGWAALGLPADLTDVLTAATKK